jgi:hypothetical protein
MGFCPPEACFELMTDFPLNHDGFPPYKKKVDFQANAYFQPNILRSQSQNSIILIDRLPFTMAFCTFGEKKA